LSLCSFALRKLYCVNTCGLWFCEGFFMGECCAASLGGSRTLALLPPTLMWSAPFRTRGGGGVRVSLQRCYTVTTRLLGGHAYPVLPQLPCCCGGLVGGRS